MINLWNYSNKIENYSTLPPDEQKEVIDVMTSEESISHYYYESYLRILIPQLKDKDLIYNMVVNYLGSRRRRGYYYSDGALDLVVKIYELVDNKKGIKDLLKNTEDKSLARAYLLLDDITEDEEELGLRALSRSKYCPEIVYTRRYKPSVKAMAKLPPVMRLKTFETMLNNRHMGYNLLSNFSDPDEFKSLLFGAVLRHRERVELVWDKYQEISYIGQEATVEIKGTCENCGEYSLTLTSTRTRTKTGFNGTRIGRNLNGSNCVLCGRYGQPKKQIICEENT